jgi:hypothetical protein
MPRTSPTFSKTGLDLLQALPHLIALARGLLDDLLPLDHVQRGQELAHATQLPPKC